MGKGTFREKRWRRRMILFIKLLLLCFVIYYVGKLLYQSFQEVDWSILAIRPRFIILGPIVLVTTCLIGSGLYKNLYTRFGANLSRKQAFVLLSVPPLGKYLPGKILSMTGHAAIAAFFGARMATAGAAIVLIMGLGLTGATLLGFTVFFVKAFQGQVNQFFTLAFPMSLILPLMLLCLHPYIYRRILDSVLRFLKKPEISITINQYQMFKFLLGFMVQIGLYISGTAIIVLGIINIPFSNLPAILGVSCIASVIGFLAVFTPAGIGVYEGTLLMLLTPITGAGTAGIVAILMRLTQTIADLSVAVVGLAVLHFIKKGNTVVPG